MLSVSGKWDATQTPHVSSSGKPAVTCENVRNKQIVLEIM